MLEQNSTEAIEDLDRVLVISRVGQHGEFAFLPNRFSILPSR